MSVGGNLKTKKQLLKDIADDFDNHWYRAWRHDPVKLKCSYKSNKSGYHYELFPADYHNVTEDLIKELDKIQATYTFLQHPENQVREKDAMLARQLKISHRSYVIRDIIWDSVDNAQL